MQNTWDIHIYVYIYIYACILFSYYHDVMSGTASKINSLTVFDQLIQAKNKANIIVPYHWRFVKGDYRWRVSCRDTIMLFFVFFVGVSFSLCNRLWCYKDMWTRHMLGLCSMIIGTDNRAHVFSLIFDPSIELLAGNSVGEWVPKTVGFESRWPQKETSCLLFILVPRPVLTLDLN